MTKNNLIMNNEWARIFSGLSDEKAGQLIKAVFAIHEGKEIEVEDPVLSAVVDMIGAVVIERKERYEETCKRNAENGRKGGEAKASNQKRKLATASDRNPDLANKKKIKEKKENKINKYSYGVYNNVLLTEEEHRKLVSEFGQQKTDMAIRFLDEYIAEKGYKSKSHYLAMRRWVFDAITKQKPAGNKFQNFPINEENRSLTAQILAMR